MLQFRDNTSAARQHELHDEVLAGGEARRVWLGVILVSVVVGVLNVSFYGDLLLTSGLIFVILFVGVSILRPSISLYMFVFIALAVEQTPQDYSWTKGIPYHFNLNSLFPSISALSFNPVEAHLLCIITGLLIRFAITREPWTLILNWKSVLAYFSAVVFFIFLGLYRGGESLPALWEVRGIGYMVVLMVLIPQVIRTKEQVNHVLWVVIAAIGFRAIEVSYHFAQASFAFEGSGDTGGWGSHEDAGLFATTIVFAVAMWALKVKGTKQKIVLSVIFIFLLLAIVGSDRRTAYPILVASLLFLAFLMPREIQRKLLRLSWKVGILFILYVAAFWNSQSDSILIMPVKSVREGLAGDDEAAAGGSYSSNLYREVENYDLYRMFRTRPLLGTGYGMLVDYYMPVPIGWALGFYIPHNQILAVPAKTGLVGLIIFLNFYLSMASGITVMFRRLKEDHYLQAVLVLAGAALVGHLVFSFFDIILTYYRTNVYVGSLFGITSAIYIIEKERAAAETAPVPPPQQEKSESNMPAPWLLGMGEKEEVPFKK